MKIPENVINYAKASAENAYYAYVADQYIKEPGVAREILMNTTWACTTKHEREFWMAGDKNGYDYYGEVANNVLRLREVKGTYVNPIEIGCESIESLANALKYLFE